MSAGSMATVIERVRRAGSALAGASLTIAVLVVAEMQPDAALPELASSALGVVLLLAFPALGYVLGYRAGGRPASAAKAVFATLTLISIVRASGPLWGLGVGFGLVFALLVVVGGKAGAASRTYDRSLRARRPEN